jgi:hypothetical protein
MSDKFDVLWNFSSGNWLSYTYKTENIHLQFLLISSRRWKNRCSRCRGTSRSLESLFDPLSQYHVQMTVGHMVSAGMRNKEGILVGTPEEKR